MEAVTWCLGSEQLRMQKGTGLGYGHRRTWLPLVRVWGHGLSALGLPLWPCRDLRRRIAWSSVL